MNLDIIPSIVALCSGIPENQIRRTREKTQFRDNTFIELEYSFDPVGALDISIDEDSRENVRVGANLLVTINVYSFAQGPDTAIEIIKRLIAFIRLPSIETVLRRNDLGYISSSPSTPIFLTVDGRSIYGHSIIWTFNTSLDAQSDPVDTIEEILHPFTQFQGRIRRSVPLPSEGSWINYWLGETPGPWYTRPKGIGRFWRDPDQVATYGNTISPPFSDPLLLTSADYPLTPGTSYSVSDRVDALSYGLVANFDDIQQTDISLITQGSTELHFNSDRSVSLIVDSTTVGSLSTNSWTVLAWGYTDTDIVFTDGSSTETSPLIGAPWAIPDAIINLVRQGAANDIFKLAFFGASNDPTLDAVGLAQFLGQFITP